MPRKSRILECFICHIQLGAKMSNLRRHMKLHSPFITVKKCPECGRIYQNKENYKTHWHAKHQGPPQNPQSVPSRAKSTNCNQLRNVQIT